MDYFWIFLVYGIVVSIVLMLVSFFDLLSIIIKLIPKQKVEGYEKYKQLKNSEDYKKHKKKWIPKMSLVSSVVYAMVYIIIYLFTKNVALGFCIGLFISILCAGRLKSKETLEKKEIENKIKNGNTDDRYLS